MESTEYKNPLRRDSVVRFPAVTAQDSWCFPPGRIYTDRRNITPANCCLAYRNRRFLWLPLWGELAAPKGED